MGSELMRYLDVCAGISALTVATRGMGWHAAGYSEIEPFPRALLPFTALPKLPEKSPSHVKRAATIRERDKARQDAMTDRLRAEIEATRKA
jgi:hypothetical protein